MQSISLLEAVLKRETQVCWLRSRAAARLLQEFEEQQPPQLAIMPTTLLQAHRYPRPGPTQSLPLMAPGQCKVATHSMSHTTQHATHDVSL